MVALLLLMAVAVSDPPPSRDPGVITITGRRLDDSDARLKACIASHCSTVEDINASLAHAENLLLAGDYRGARSVLHASLGRNKGEGRRYPVEVSDLYRANAVIANHLGFDNDYKLSTINVYRTLKSGLPAQDSRVLAGQMEYAAMLAKAQGLESGEREYLNVARAARNAGREDIAGLAEVRAAWLGWKMDPGTGKARMQSLLRKRPALAPFALNYAKLFSAAIARNEGHDEEADRLIRETMPATAKPALIYSPPFELQEREISRVDRMPSTAGDLVDANVLNRPSRNYDGMWIDVSFLVQPDGTVSDVDIVKAGKDAFWAKPLIESIKGRRYTPFRGDLPYPRLERYTYTASYYQLSGSRIPVRSPKARIEYLDLTL